MIAYSPPAQRARAYLQAPFNDLDVFVEDITCQNLYVRLINRLLGARGSIFSVFPLGSRREVLEACERDQAARGRPRLYVIDGDLDLWTGKRAPALRYLYRLRVYSIENLVIDERAILEVASEGRPGTNLLALKQELQVAQFLETAAALLTPLFVAYAVSHKLDLPIQTVGYRVLRLCTTANDPRTISRRLVRQRLHGVVAEIRAQVGRDRYRRTRNAILKRLRKVPQQRLPCLISGKAYMLPLVHMLLIATAGVRDAPVGIATRLASHSNLDVERSLRRAVRTALATS